ncbi:hypothetical protein lerEdw1_000718 [Lerista edwardsae]|nr:hypothetical protein lerEdw1_000718 [Lerista edwardsae]
MQEKRQDVFTWVLLTWSFKGPLVRNFQLAVVVLKGLAMEMAIVMAMALEVVTDRAAVKKSTKENFAWTVLMATTTLSEMIHILCVQVPLNWLDLPCPFVYMGVTSLEAETSMLEQNHDCHTSCKTCTGATNVDCKECKEGWIRNEEACVACDISCLECIGEGPSKCKNCIPGYEMKDEKCTVALNKSSICHAVFVDVDECTQPDKVCVGENEDCMNTPGGYKCICSEGFQSHDGTCVPIVKAEEEIPANVSSPDAHEDL